MEHHTPTPITGHTALICLLGSPCAHSISPMMHNASFEALGLDYRYLAFDVNEAYHYAFRAGRNLPDKEFRYLRTVIVTAAVYLGLSSMLRLL